MQEFIVKNEQTQEEQRYSTIAEIVRYFKDSEKYKIPNFLKETLKTGNSITIKAPSGKYLIIKENIND